MRAENGLREASWDCTSSLDLAPSDHQQCPLLGQPETIKKLPRVNSVVLNYIPIKVLLRGGKKASTEARSSLPTHPPLLSNCCPQLLFKQGFSPRLQPHQAPGLHSCPFPIVPSLSGSFHGGRHRWCASPNKRSDLYWSLGNRGKNTVGKITNRRCWVPCVPIVLSLAE